MSADLIIAGDRLGWNDLMYVAVAVAWGQAIEVPELTLWCANLLSPLTFEMGKIGDYAARISTPGVARSGYKIMKQLQWAFDSLKTTI